MGDDDLDRIIENLTNYHRVQGMIFKNIYNHMNIFPI
jgi:hypothetical protein